MSRWIVVQSLNAVFSLYDLNNCLCEFVLVICREQQWKGLVCPNDANLFLGCGRGGFSWQTKPLIEKVKFLGQYIDDVLMIQGMISITICHPPTDFKCPGGQHITLQGPFLNRVAEFTAVRRWSVSVTTGLFRESRDSLLPSLPFLSLYTRRSSLW